MNKTSIPPVTTVINGDAINGNELFIGPPQDQVPAHKEPLLPPISTDTLKLFGKLTPSYVLKRLPMASSIPSNKFQYRHSNHMPK